MKPSFLRRLRAVLTLGGLGLTALAVQADAEYELGRKLFLHKTQPACALCHTLKDAGAEGAVGPVLDELRPDAARVARAVRDGLGAMPPFKQQLSEAELKALARYVSVASGGAR